MDYNWIRGQQSFRDFLCNASETCGEKLLLNQKIVSKDISFPPKTESITSSNFWLVINQKYELNFVKMQRRATFYASSWIAWMAGCGWAFRAMEIVSISDTNIHVRYKCSFLWSAAIWRWTTCSLQCTYLWIWPAIFAPVPTYELEQPSTFDFTQQIDQIPNDRMSPAAVYLQLGLCKYSVALLPPTSII